MASSSSTAASTSTSTAVSLMNYDVFINHRGPDVKKTFASYLYRRLLIHGLRVFLDQEELQEGEDLTPQIHGAIRTASVQVAIFSPRYAESSWCLDELVLMLETLENGATILPVFYNVKPSDLRWNRGLTGLYAEALLNLENKKTNEGNLRYQSAKLEKWRKDLSRVTDKSGFELAKYDGDEGELLDKVVERVLKKVKKPGLEVAKHPTGLDDKMKDFETSVLIQQRQSGKPHIFGIVGLGGVGKTTLAKKFFNSKNSDYQISCFLSDVRDSAAKGSLHLLQRKLLKSLTGTDNQINHIDEGTEMLMHHLSSSKALVILDDVDEVKQVDALFPVRTTLHPNSLILITSRNRDVVRGSRVEDSSIYNLSGLNAHHSRELFCFHAFCHAHPRPGFEDLVDKFLEGCDGLPLSLIVFGALVYGKNDPSYWEDQLDRLKEILPTEIKQRLQISYDALGVQEQHIFLDIACFFIGTNKDTAVKIWDGSGWKGRLGFSNIENRCLVKVDSESCIHMHDHLRDLGRDLAEAPGLPLRLWRGMENISQQLSDEQVIREVRGIRMIGENNDSDDQFACFSWCQSWSHDLRNRQDCFRGISMKSLLLLDAEDEGGLLKVLFQRAEVPNPVWIRWKRCTYSSLPSWIGLKNLRVLQMESDQLKTLWQNESQAPLLLRVLEISSPLSRIPKSIGQLKYLERIVVSGGRQVTLPEEFCHLQSLKILELEGCSEMKTLPPSLGDLRNLEKLKLRDCRKLKCLPSSARLLTQLTELDIYDCPALSEVPFEMVEGERETLGASSSLDSSIEHCMPRLQSLHLLATKISKLSFSAGVCPNLQYLYVWSCDDIVEIGTLPNTLVTLDLWECRNLRKIKGLCGLPNLRRLVITQCREVEELASVETLISLEYLSVWGCGKVKSIGGLGQLTKLKTLIVWECRELEELAGIEDVRSLVEIDVRLCPKVQWKGGVVEQLQQRGVKVCVSAY